MLKLTADQQKTLDEFNIFMLDATRRTFVIDGRPGCGKTTLVPVLINHAQNLKAFLKSLLNLDGDIHVELTATTNKAAEALKEKLPNYNVSTIHSFLNLRVVNDFSTGKQKLHKTNNYYVHENVLLFVDEMSMADSELLKIISDSTLNCKVVYLLDKNQILPVFENEVPLLSKFPLNAVLSEIVRQQVLPCGSLHPIAVLSGQLTAVVENKTKLFPLVGDNTHIFTCTKREFGDAINQHFVEPDAEHKYRILAWTNKKVQRYNDHVRKLLGKTEMYQKGEFLIVNDTYSPNGAVALSNQEEVLVIDVDDTKYEWKDTEIMYQGITVRNKKGIVYKVRVPLDFEFLDKWVKYYAKIKDFSAMFNLKSSFIDLRPMYASTVHKSQGSTFDTVFIDVDDICSNNKLEEVRRLILVASSRPSFKIYFCGEIPKKYLE